MSSTVEKLPASFTTAQVLEHGVSCSTLYRLRDRGEVVELSRGVWRRADAPPTAHESLLAVALRAPHGTICLLSALALHELTDEIPSRVHLAVPRGQHRPRITYPPVEVYVFDPATFELGREWVEVAPDERLPVYGEVRSTVDALRMRNQLGTDIAYGAARRLLSRRRAAAGELLSLSRRLRCAGPVGDALEVLQA